MQTPSSMGTVMWEEKWVSRVHTQHHAASANYFDYKRTFVHTDTDSTLLYRPYGSAEAENHALFS